MAAILNLIECTASQVVAGDVLNLDRRMFPFVPDFTATVIANAALQPELPPLFHHTVAHSRNHSHCKSILTYTGFERVLSIVAHFARALLSVVQHRCAP